MSEAPLYALNVSGFEPRVHGLVLGLRDQEHACNFRIIKYTR